MGVLVVTWEEHQQLRREFEEFKSYVLDYFEDVDDEVRGTEQAGKLVGVSRSTIDRLMKQGKIPYSKHGRSVSFSRKDLVAYKRSRRINKS